MLFALSACWMAGSVVGWHVGTPLGDLLPAVAFIVAGGLVALDAALPAAVLAGLAGLIGLGQGWGYGSAAAAVDLSWPALAGCAAAVLVSVEVYEGMQAGHVSLPNGLGLDEEHDGGVRRVGVEIGRAHV